MDISLSDKEVLKLAKRPTRFLLYRKLKRFKNIDDVFGKKDNLVLLYESENDPNYGHFVALRRDRKLNRIYFYDPYGIKLDGQLNNGKNDLPYLTQLLRKSKYATVYNKYQQQQYSEDAQKKIATCGRHAGLFIRYGQDLKGFRKLLKNIKNKQGLNPDEAVLMLSKPIIGK